MNIQKQLVRLPAGIALGGEGYVDVAVGVTKSLQHARRAPSTPGAGPIKQIEDTKDNKNAN